MGYISFETTRSVVNLRLKGSGTAKINWNDGTPVKAVEITKDGTKFESEPYSGERTITIEGDKITYLKCTDNLITKLQLDDNPELEVLRCRDNKLKELNISSLMRLKILSCSDNKLKSLNLSKNINLVEIRCLNNELSELDLSNLSKLEICHCAGNNNITLIPPLNRQLKEIHEISDGVFQKSDIIIEGESKLMVLSCKNQEHINSIKIRNCPNLVRFDCENNPELSSVILENLPQLGYVFVAGNERLTNLQIDEDCPNVGDLDCSRNAIKNLNVCDRVNLQYLNCSANALNNLIIEGCSKLRTLNCGGNSLSKLEIGVNEEGVSNFPDLEYLYCGYNNLSDETLNNIFTGLPAIDSKKIAELYFSGNPGETACDTKIAADKNWQINPPLALVVGNEPIIPENDIHPIVKSVLGRGYDISGEYAVAEGKDVVLDFDKLNERKRISVYPGSSAEGTVVSGEGKKNYSKTVEEKLNIKVSGSIFGVSFSNDTTKGFTKEETNDESYKYVMRNVIHAEGKYSITGVAAPQHVILGALTHSFLTALETQSGKEIIANFGTHIIGGMVLGSAMRYYMRFQKSITSMSQTKTFSQSNSIGYGSGGTEEAAKEENDKAKKDNEALSNNKKSFGEIIADAIAKGVSVAAVKEAYAALKEVSKKPEKEQSPEEKEKNKKKKDEANSKLSHLGVEISTQYTESETINTHEEMENTEIKCCLVGGNSTEVSHILTDPTNKCDTWLESCKESKKWAWIDFVKDTIIPIYEFVPDAHPKKNEIIKAWDAYLCSKGIDFNEYVPVDSIIIQDFQTRRLRNITTFLEHGDWEMYTQKGSNQPIYSLSFELVNIDGGRAGVDVILKVDENTGKKSSTIIEVHDLIELKSAEYDRIAIHPSYMQRKYHAITDKLFTPTGKNIRLAEKGDKLADWANLTAQAKSNSYCFKEDVVSIDKPKTYRGCLDPDAQLWIQLDGDDDDYKNVGVEGRFMVKIWGYKPKIR